MATSHSIQSECRARYLARKRGENVPKLRPGTKPRPFWDLVEKTESCWQWKGFISHYGYGMYSNGGNHRAHRYAYALTYGLFRPA
jgi:hypothetical protein